MTDRIFALIALSGHSGDQHVFTKGISEKLIKISLRGVHINLNLLSSIYSSLNRGGGGTYIR